MDVENLIIADLTLVEGETFLSSFETPSEGSNRQNRTKETEIATFISRTVKRSSLRIKSTTLKQNRFVNSADFHAHKTKV